MCFDLDCAPEDGLWLTGRMASLRGYPTQILSDRGTNFVVKKVIYSIFGNADVNDEVLITVFIGQCKEHYTPYIQQLSDKITPKAVAYPPTLLYTHQRPETKIETVA